MIEKQRIIDDFRLKKFGDLCSDVPARLEYHLWIELLPEPPFTFDSIKSVTLRRKWEPSDDSYDGLVWTTRGRQIRLEARHFNKVEFDYAEENAGHSLSLLCVLALKTKYDEQRGMQRGGILFRSEMHALQVAGIWRNGPKELDSLVSDSITRKAVDPYSQKPTSPHESGIASSAALRSRKNNVPKSQPTRSRRPDNKDTRSVVPFHPRIRDEGGSRGHKTRRYVFHPLLRRFLLAKNEIYNMVCWTGHREIDTVSGTACEKMWVLNAEPAHIHVLSGYGVELSPEFLQETLSCFFSNEFLVTEQKIEEYEKVLAKGLAPTFPYPVAVQPRHQAETDSAEILRLWAIDRKYEEERIPQIIDFGDVFQKHPPERFVGREWLFQTITDHLKAPQPPSQYLLIIGEPGIGKTALLTNYIRHHDPEAVHYFIQRRKQKLDNPSTLLLHLYFALSKKYKLEFGEIPGSPQSQVECLKRRMRELHDTKRIKKQPEVIFIDGLDEAIPETPGLSSIANYLDLELPDEFLLVICSNSTPELKRFQLDDHSNVIYFTGKDEHNKADLRSHLEQLLAPWTIDPDTINSLAEASDGSFQYATLLLKTLQDRDASIDELRNHPPQGLDGIYDLRIDSVFKRLATPAERRAARRTLRILSLLQSPPHKRDLFEFASLDYSDGSLLLETLEQFLDLDALRENHLCRFFHDTLRGYMIHPDRLSEQDSRRLQLAIARTIRRHLTTDCSPDQMRYALRYFIHHSRLAHDHKRCLSFSKTAFLPIKLRSHTHAQVLPDIFACLVLATEVKDQSGVAFYGLLFWIFYLNSIGRDSRYNTDRYGRKYRQLSEATRARSGMHTTLALFAQDLGLDTGADTFAGAWNFADPNDLEYTNLRVTSDYLRSRDLQGVDRIEIPILRLYPGESVASLIQQGTYFTGIRHLIPLFAGLIADYSPKEAYAFVCGLNPSPREFLESVFQILVPLMYKRDPHVTDHFSDPEFLRRIEALLNEFGSSESPLHDQILGQLAVIGFPFPRTSWRNHLTRIESPTARIQAIVGILHNAGKEDSQTVTEILNLAIHDVNELLSLSSLDVMSEGLEWLGSAVEDVGSDRGMDLDDRVRLIRGMMPLAIELAADREGCISAYLFASRAWLYDAGTAVAVYYHLTEEMRGRCRVGFGFQLIQDLIEGRMQEGVNAPTETGPSVPIDCQRQNMIRDLGEQLSRRDLQRLSREMIAPTRTIKRRLLQLKTLHTRTETLRRLVQCAATPLDELIPLLSLLIRRFEDTPRQGDRDFCLAMARKVASSPAIACTPDEDLVELIDALCRVDFQLAYSLLPHVKHPRFKAEAMLNLANSRANIDSNLRQELLTRCSDSILNLSFLGVGLKPTLQSRLLKVVASQIGRHSVTADLLQRCVMTPANCLLLCKYLSQAHQDDPRQETVSSLDLSELVQEIRGFLNSIFDDSV